MAREPAECETPALVIDEATALKNITRFQAHCDRNGLKLRPHVKTHKSVRFAKAQVAAGAVGITCQKIGEAEVMAACGMDDILITYNIVGEAKLTRLRALAGRVKSLSVTADSTAVIKGLTAAFENAPRPVDVLVECDTGGRRCGVRTPEAAIGLARTIAACPGLRFGGLMTFPEITGQRRVTDFMHAARAGIEALGIRCTEVSSGGSPDMWRAGTGGVVTEYRAGTYIFNDRSLVSRGTCAWSDCAAHVVATVVSVPTESRAIIDAGSKVLTSDLLDLEGFGHIIGHPGMRITGLSEEHGVVRCDPDDRLGVGNRVRIIPNHICVVTNMFDFAWLRREGNELAALPIDARGKVT